MKIAIKLVKLIFLIKNKYVPKTFNNIKIIFKTIVDNKLDLKIQFKFSLNLWVYILILF